jgi:hypothetical protein
MHSTSGRASANARRIARESGNSDHAAMTRLLIMLAACAVLVWLGVAQGDAADRAPGWNWLEDSGIGVALPAAAADSRFPRLLAGITQDDRAAALWELGPGGAGALIEHLSAQAGQPSEFALEPLAFGESLRGRLTPLNAGSAAMLDFQANGRHLAFVASGATGIDDLLRDFVLVPGAVAGTLSPLLLEGRYAAVLSGWERAGERYFKRMDGGWLGLRFFALARDGFDSLEALQTELEAQLVRRGFRPAPALRPEVAGTTGFLRLYFRDDGYVQRVMYARLRGGYLVALLQGPEALQEDVIRESEALATGIVALPLEPPQPPAPPGFAAVRQMRCVAWQEDGRVYWGLLFDRADGSAAIWREDGVPWRARLMRDGAVIAERAGVVGSGARLNPLREAALRALEVPEGDGGLELVVEVNGRTARTPVAAR